MAFRYLMGRALGVFVVMLVALVNVRGRLCVSREAKRRKRGKKRERGRRRFVCLRPSPRVCTRAFVSPPACPLGRLLVWQSDGCVGGCGFSVNDCFAACDGEAVVCGASAVDAGVEGDGCGVALDGGVECVGAGFAPASPDGAVVCGFVHACTLVCACGRLFDHGLGCACVSWLFAGVLGARVGDPCVCDGSEGLAGRDGGGVSACWSIVVAFVVVQGCVNGDGVALVLSVVCECAARLRVHVSREGEHAVFCGHDGFTDQHVCECLLFTRHPFVDLALCERYADGGEGLALVAWGGEGAGGDVRICCADGGGLGFALVEEDEGEAGDSACVVGVGVEVCALDDAAVCVCAHILTVCACAHVLASGVAVAECDGEAGSVAERDDVTVVVLHVAAVEELVEGGGELVCVADGVLCGARWSKAVFDVVPRVHGWFLFLSVVFCLFLCALVACSSRARVGGFPFARAFSCSSWYHMC